MQVSRKSLIERGFKSLPRIRNPRFRAYIREALEKAAGGGDFSDLIKASQYKHFPVSIEEFIESKEFMDSKDKVYPLVMRELIEINSGRYVEVVFTGGIGSGKTTAALYTCAYQLYLLSCLKDPHKVFGLDPSTEILVMFQNITETLAKRVGFSRFKSMLEKAPYFTKVFTFRRDLETRLVFSNRIEAVPTSATGSAAIGQNVIGGMIDELNYMQVVENSKQSVDGGTYDQAIEAYNSIARRRKSRFATHGHLPGILCLVSSRRYPGQFTDIKEEEAKTDPTIYIYDKCMWDIKPDSFEPTRFRVFIGDEARKPRVLREDEEVTDEAMVRYIPTDFIQDFNRDIINALREIAGVSTLARFPFITNPDAVRLCAGKVTQFISRDDVDFQETRLDIDPDLFYRPHLPRAAHVDLAVSGDSAGVVIGCVPEFVTLQRGSDQVEMLPKIRVDMTLEVKPPKNGEILFYKIRELFYTLQSLGLNLRWITFDGYQSTDSMQLLQKKGFITGLISMDTSPVPYNMTKDAFYDERIEMPYHPKLIHELATLERDPKKGKIDHPPHSSKDISDALAGVVYRLTMQREIWTMFKIPTHSIPPSLRVAMQKENPPT